MAAPGRLDPAPLIAAAGGNLRGLARQLGIDPSNLCRPITVDQADRWSIALGHLPHELWGAAWWDAIDPD